MAKHLSASKERCDECLDSLSIEVAREGVPATLRFKYLRFDPMTGEPMFRKLAACLADHLVSYCFSAKRLGKPRTPEEHHKLHREARELLRRNPKSGEAGEILVYFLLEAVLEAPQMVAKMDLKTNQKMESLGSDGIHMKWNEVEHFLEIFFAESKLEQTVTKAVTSAVASLGAFQAKRQFEHELRLVTGHFKHADERVRSAVLRLIDGKEPGGECRIRHACLIGYSWSEYKKLPALMVRELKDEFRRRYDADRNRLHDLIKQHFANFDRTVLHFEIFFLPFRDVQEFRDAFYEAI